MTPDGPAPASVDPTKAGGQRWQRFSAGLLRAYHAYASWLVSISWWRFSLLSIAVLIVMGFLHDNPPFTWTVTEHVETDAPRARIAKPPKPPVPPKPPQASAVPESPATPTPPTAASTPAATPAAPMTPSPAKPPSVGNVTPAQGESSEGVDISIGKDGIRIVPRPQRAAASAAPAPVVAAASGVGVHISLPAGATSQAVREAVEAARREIEDALRDAAEARRDAERAIADVRDAPRRSVRRTRVGIGDMLMQLTVLWLLASLIIKATYKSRLQAERQAARATETAESESLKRQVVEARMAAMQAQVEPHFLFNTLASIDHLIETDPGRASRMQKNLIALLRASMPTLREASDGGVRELGRELAVIRPYLEILKVRMEERLATRIEVPEGLLSAEFPPMMIQTLVENAIKHGLEPKAEGGEIAVNAEIVHGKLQVSVADTGLGFGRAATAGSGVGLANIRERLQLLYGPRASLTVAGHQPSGTIVTITVPYRTLAGTPT